MTTRNTEMPMISEEPFLVHWTNLTTGLPPYDDLGYKDNYRLLVRLEHGTITEATYWGNGDFYLYGKKIINVVAWMLLPRHATDQRVNHDFN